MIVGPSPALALSSFFFNDTATTEIYTLSLHDALPITEAPRWARRASLDPEGLGHRDPARCRLVQAPRSIESCEAPGSPWGEPLHFGSHSPWLFGSRQFGALPRSPPLRGLGTLALHRDGRSRPVQRSSRFACSARRFANHRAPFGWHRKHFARQRERIPSCDRRSWIDPNSSSTQIAIRVGR